ncbi:SPFH domain-containing protein [Streptomyces microflavus]|uniref:SPFH domain-containing protein n=1 Tax=Streptomyces microflavus TaxID=1919 RepID=UPI00386A5B43|nr:SPFH domain-containing protein [Streptomyces microflavus]WST15025.1 SPFH domain-containing protein [Streptomyces microflavus]
MTPDQNPHPLTDHDGHAPHGETPMPLVDGVALRGPGPATPPPLFRPREEAEKPAVGEVSPEKGAFGDPARGAEAVGDLFPATGAFGDPAPAAEATGDPFPAANAFGDPAPVTDLIRDPAPESGAISDPFPAANAFGDPAPVTDLIRDPAPETDAFSDPFPAANAFGAAAPVTDLIRDPAPESDAFSDPFPATDATGDPAPTAGAAADQTPTADTIADQAQAQAPAPALSSAVDPASSQDPDPDLPLKPDRPDHPGRSLHLEAGAPHVRPVGPGSPAVSDGPAHFQPVRRLRTEPSAEWTPLPSYGEEAGPRPEPPSDVRADSGAGGPDGGAATPSAGTDDPGPGPELDLVLDLAPGARATSATFSVPAPYPPPHPRRHSVIANESTASIPVHLLFRDDPETPEPTALPPAAGRTARRSDTTTGTTADRTPRPRSPHPRVEPPTRPAPLADPRLAERPGPALSGYAALLTGAAGLLGVLAVLWWRGALPAAAQSAVGLAPRPYEGIGAGAWALLALLVTVVVLALGGLGRGRVGYAWVLTLFGDYRGSVRRTGLVWVSPLLLRRRVDVRLRHWRSEPLPAVDANGTALRVVVLVVWRIKDTVRAALGIEDHEAYLSAQVESAMARVLSQLPADAFHEDAPTLRNAEAVGDALTRMLKADCEPVGVEVYSAQPTGIEYAPEVAAAMQRRRIAAIDAKHRDSVLTSVVDAVDDTVNRLTTRGIVDLDDYERKALVKDLTVAFYTGRSGTGDGA